MRPPIRFRVDEASTAVTKRQDIQPQLSVSADLVPTRRRSHPAIKRIYQNPFSVNPVWGISRQNLRKSLHNHRKCRQNLVQKFKVASLFVISLRLLLGHLKQIVVQKKETTCCQETALKKDYTSVDTKYQV